MKELSILAFKRIIRQAGARASDEAARELARLVEEMAREIAELSKTLAEHAGRQTVKEKDVQVAVKEWKAR
ncbi:MAG: NFYB/HAP3 family transcription factor subunit [Candidatus Helarchaeota archaeon]|nr:NFYB/HAP3 family transcription factor subunit [Candidatus Helarchaeota archaeon]